MGAIWVIVKTILKMFANMLLGLLPEQVRPPVGFLAKLKRPFSFFGGNTREKIKEFGIKGLIKEGLKKIIQKFKSILQTIGNVVSACSDIFVIVIAVICVGTMLNAIIGVFGSLTGPFSGKINIDFDKFEEMNVDTSIYMDAQNTNELRKAYMQLVSETSYYQVFNLRDLNPNSMNTVTNVYAKLINKLYDWGLAQDDLDQLDLNYFNMTRNWIGWGTMDNRYIYSDANKNALKYMKLPKIIGINVDEKDLKTNLNAVNETFRDYYNRETTFQISETLLTEMNRILFGEFSNLETITYPEAFVKPVAFVNDFYRIQETGKKENIGSPYVYVTQRVTLRDINNISSVYYQKDWLEGIIKSEPSHIIYDYVVEQKNNYYWSEADNKLATQMSWGNIGKYATATETIEYEDGVEVDKESAIKLYWRAIDTRLRIDSGKPNADDGNNPFNEHMGTTITNKNYKTFFDGPYTKLTKKPDNSLELSNKICDGDKSIVYIDPKTGSSSDSYIDGWVKVRCEYNKYPIRHMQLVSVFDEYGDMQLNSRVLFNKTFVQKKSVRDSYRFFPEYFSGFEDFANVDLQRCPPAMGYEAYASGDTAITTSGGSCTFENWMGHERDTCTAEDYENDAKLPFNQRHCSVIRKYTGTSGYAYLWAKWKEFGQSVKNVFTGLDEEAEINVSSESMFYLLLAYDDYIIETGEYGVAWDYKYYTETELDLAFKKAQYRDIYGLKEIFVDKWGGTAVYKKTLDTVKALDAQRTVSTTYVPTSIISGQTALCKDQNGKCNNNNNNSGYGWKVSNIASDAASQELERVKGEASLELPIYSSGSLITKITDYITNGVHYGPDDFRYSYDSTGDIVDSGEVSWETYIEDLDSHAASKGTAVEGHDGNTVSLVDALKAYNEGGDWRNTTEAWDPEAKAYRPMKSDAIHTNVTTYLYTSDGSNNPYGRVSYKTYQGDYLPFETKSVRDYGLGSVLSYIQDMRVVYQTGVFMDETYVGKSAFEKSFETIINDSDISDNFKKAGNGYYPKELLDKYPALTEALRSTPIPIEDLMDLAQNIVSLQYAATDYEMELAEEKASSKKYEDIRDELLKIVSGRNMAGIYVGPVNEGIDGFPLISKSDLDPAIKNSDVVKNDKSTNICESAYDKCTGFGEDDIEGLKQCLLQAQATGAYYNEGLFDCERRCKAEAETEIKGLHPDLNEEEKAEKEATIKEKETRCLKVCEENWPDLSQICTYSTTPDKLKGVYAYSPYLSSGFWNNVLDSTLGWFIGKFNNFSQVQFLDPLQYYIEWFDYKAEEDPDIILPKMLEFIDSEFVTKIHVAGSAKLLSIQNNNSGLSKVNVDQHFLNIGSDFAGAGENIVGEFKQDFYNQYGQDLQPMNLILENESYRIYMIDEAVTFLGTFNYTYKNDIVNIGGGSSNRQVSGLAYADRYYYLSNYIFNVPMIEYKVEYMGGGSKGGWKQPACPSYSVSDAQKDVNGNVWNTIVAWFTGEAKPKVLDAGTSCKTTSELRNCSNCCSCRVCDIVEGERVCSYESCDCDKPYYTTHYEYYASVSDVLPAEDGYIIDTPAEIEAVLNKASSLDSSSTLRDRVYIGMKVYDSLSDWSWGYKVNKANIDKKFSHDYNEDYLSLSGSGRMFHGDTDNHYQNLSDVNDNITARKGYVVPDAEVTGFDGAGLPDDLHMTIDLDAGLQHPVALKNGKDKSGNDLYEIWRAADAVVGFTADTDTVGGSDGWSSLTLNTGTSVIHEDEYDEIGVGLFVANRESYGHPIPLFRHFSGVMREILPRQRGYYFNGEVFDSWQSRLILTEETTEAQKEAIFDEKNKTQSYLYDYIMNFETYVPMDVKSDYDLMSRARDAYHSTLNTKTNHVENTAVLSNDIYNLANTPAWEETIKKLGDELDATAVSQLISGLLEVSIDRAPEKMISVLNQNILDDDKKVANTSANRSVIENAVNSTLMGGSSNLNASGGAVRFNNTLFLGDSLTDGMKNAGLFNNTGAVVDAVVGRGIVATKNAAKAYSNYGTVVINIGMNDAVNTDSVFESNYKDLVNTVKSKNPGATIYIGSISGINDSLASSWSAVTNAHINNKNRIIEKIASDLGVNFIDVNAYLGNISTSDTSDGIHLNNNKYTEWFTYICNRLGVGAGNSGNMVEVTLSLEDGSSKSFRLTDVGPGVIFYNYNPDTNGNLPAKDTISTGDIIVNCGLGTDYTVCFDDVSLTINDTTDERLDKVKALKYVSNKFGKLVQKYGDVKYAILAYFHGEAFATKVQLKGDADWFNKDDANKVADILAEITGDDSVRMNASKINMFMYTNDVVSETLSYVQSNESKTVLNNASTIPAAASGVPLGERKDEAQRVYNKWKPLFDTFCAEYQVDLALAVAMFTQESSGNAFAGLCKGDSVSTWTTGATAVCTEVYSNVYNSYNGGGGIGQIHHLCPNPGGGSHNASPGEKCTRAITSTVTGKEVVVKMQNPEGVVSSIADMPAFLANDERYGNIEKAFEWAIILISNHLQTANNDGFLAATMYNGFPYKTDTNPNGCSIKDPNWYSCYTKYRNETTTYPDYVKHIARYYDPALATAELNTNFGLSYSGASAGGGASFGLQTGNIAFQRDMFQIQNSGVELYIPRMTTSRDDVTTLILNVSNFGKEDYYMYANEHNLLDFFTERLDDASGSANNFLGGNPQISKLGTKTSKEVPANYKFAFITPLIPLQSPIATVRNVSDLNVTDTFGMRESHPIYGDRRMHHGIDIAYSTNPGILAAAEGRVSLVKNDGENGYGLWIEVEHTVPANTIVTDSSGKRYQIVGLFTRYAHLADAKVVQGDVISSNCASAGGSGKCLSLGDPIGIMGDSGDSSGPHLHFEVFVKAKDLETGQLLDNTNENTKCDPYYWLSTEWTLGAGLVEGAMSSAEIDSIIATIKSYHPTLSQDREYILRNALSLVGGVPYFYGGGHTHPPYKGVNPSWGRDMRTCGHNSPHKTWYVGRVALDGLDCSGFVSWTSYNTFGTHYYSSGDTVSKIADDDNTKNIRKSELLPGDWAYNTGHIGIYAYTDSNGKDWFIHCTDKGNEEGVVFEIYNGFNQYLRADYVN